MSTNTKKQHYIPRHILSNFLGENKKVYYIVKKTGEIREQVPKEIGHENYFYHYPDTPKVPENGLESYTESIDTPGSSVIKDIISNESVLNISLKEKYVLFKYIALLINRTPHIMKDKMRSVKSMKEHFGDVVPVDLSGKTAKDFTKKSVKTDFLNKLKLRTDFNVTQMKNHKIDLIKSTLDEPFVISDVPVFFRRHSSQYEIQVIFNEIQSEIDDIIIPISPEISLYLYKDKKHSISISELNINQAMSAENFIFSHKKSILENLEGSNILRPKIAFSDDVQKQLSQLFQTNQNQA